MPAIFPAVMELSNINGQNGVVLNGNPGDSTSASISIVGDVNGDGKADFLIGAPFASPGGRIAAGCAYLVFGGSWLMGNPTLKLSTLNGITGVRINGVSSGDETGWSVSGAGDVNGDGKADFLIGAYGTDPGGRSSAGSAYLVFGGPWLMDNPTLELSTLNGTTGVRINGVSSADSTGAVSIVGDVNDDGMADFLLGAPNASPGGRTSAGSAYLVFGGPWLMGNATLELSALNGTTGVRINGVSSADRTGDSVSSAGDVNGDGKAEFLIGAYGADPGGRSDAGSAYLIFGGSWLMGDATLELSTLNGTTGVRINGVSFDDFTGISLSSAGDVNGDGKSDFIIGAYSADPGGRSHAGGAYLVFGGSWLMGNATLELSTLNGTTGVRINGVSSGDGAGYSVCSADDVNADGKADILIGAYGAKPDGKVFAGSVYLVFGGSWLMDNPTLELSTLDGTTGIRINGVSSGDQAGRSVSSAGDVNTDGKADFIIGADSVSSLGDGVHAGSSYLITNLNQPQANNTVRNVVIGVGISATLLLGIFGLRTCLKRKTDKNLNNFLTSSAPADEKEQSKFDRKVIASITNRIFERIRTTNILSYRSESGTRDYIAAIQRMVWKLDDFGINLDFDSMGATDREFLLSEIVQHTKKLSVPSQEGYFTKFYSFFSAEMTPNQLDSKVNDIAFAIKESVTKSRPNLILEPGASSRVLSGQSIIRVKGSDDKKLVTTK